MTSVALFLTVTSQKHNPCCSVTIHSPTCLWYSPISFFLTISVCPVHTEYKSGGLQDLWVYNVQHIVDSDHWRGSTSYSWCVIVTIVILTPSYSILCTLIYHSHCEAIQYQVYIIYNLATVHIQTPKASYLYTSHQAKALKSWHHIYIIYNRMHKHVQQSSVIHILYISHRTLQTRQHRSQALCVETGIRS